MNTPYWMVERGSPAEWFVSIQGHGTDKWTHDASKAQHLTKEGADWHVEKLPRWGVQGELRATEHIDCDGPDLGPTDESGVPASAHQTAALTSPDAAAPEEGSKQ